MSALIAELLVPFSYEYMVKAMWVSALVGGVCAFLSAYLMLKGWSLMGDALAHSIVPGVAGAYILGLPFAVGAFFAGILASLGMGFVKQHTRLREDAVIGLVFTSLFALGLLMASIWPTSVSDPDHRARQHPGDLRRGRRAGRDHRRGLARRSWRCKWKDLMVTFFDESHARSIGLNTVLLKVLFFTLLSACTVAALQTVGACLVIAMVVTPGATAYLLTDRFGRLIVISVALGAATSFVGAYISYLPRRRDRRRDRHAADAAVPGGVLSSRPSTACWRRAGGAAAAVGRPRMMTLIDWISVPLSYPFMQRALIVAVLVGAVCAVLSCYLVLKGWSLMGDAISHAVLPGIVIAYRARPAARARRLRGRPVLRAAHRLSEGEQPGEGGHGDGHRVLRHVRLGLVIFTKVETDQHLNHILFGNVLGVTVRDLIETAIIAGGTLLIVLLKRRDLLLYCFDPNHARAIGLPVRALHYGLLVLLSLTIVASLKAVGIILVIAMLVAPGATAYLLTDSFERMLVIATVVATASAALGTHPELPYRRRDRRLHRADPGGGVRAGAVVRAEAGAGVGMAEAGAGSARVALLRLPCSPAFLTLDVSAPVQEADRADAARCAMWCIGQARRRTLSASSTGPSGCLFGGRLRRRASQPYGPIRFSPPDAASASPKEADRGTSTVRNAAWPAQWGFGCCAYARRDAASSPAWAGPPRNRDAGRRRRREPRRQPRRASAAVAPAMKARITVARRARRMLRRALAIAWSTRRVASAGGKPVRPATRRPRYSRSSPMTP